MTTYKDAKNLQVGDKFKDYGAVRTVTKVVRESDLFVNVHYATGNGQQILPMLVSRRVAVVE